MINFKINVRLKDTVEVFTKRLYYLLFDEQDGDCKYLKERFLELTNGISYTEGNQLWQNFKSKVISSNFLNILKALSRVLIGNEVNALFRGL